MTHDISENVEIIDAGPEGKAVACAGEWGLNLFLIPDDKWSHPRLMFRLNADEKITVPVQFTPL